MTRGAGGWARSARMTVVAALAAAVAACGGGGEDDGRLVLHRGNNAEPLTLDPHKAQGVWENAIIGDMLIGLFTDDPEGRPIPGMAEDWTVSDDGLVWTFTLREATWSDGVAVTAGDFVFAVRRLLTPETLSQYASLLYLVEGAQAIHEGRAAPETLGVRAVDERTLEWRLRFPAPYLPGLLTHYTTFPLPRHVVEAVGDDWVRPEHIQVNGPFKLTQWRTNDFVAVEKNPLFFDADAVCLDEVVYYPTNDNAAAERRVRSGELDLNAEFPGQKIDFLREALPGYVHVSPGLVTTYLAFNTRREPFSDPRVRRALAMAVDRDFIVSEILRAGQVTANSFVPPSVANYPDGPRAPWADLDLQTRRAQALALLEEAGFGPDRPLRFVYSHRNTRDNPRVAPILQDNWRSLADWVDVELMATETQIHYENLRTRTYDVADAGWVADYNDAQNFLYLATTEAGPLNYPDWSDPEYDRLMDAANRELDGAARAALMREAEALMLADAPMAPVWHEVNKSLVNPRVTGWRENALQINRSRYLCFTDADADADGVGG